MNKPSMYLAGPITGLSYEQVTEWRTTVTQTLEGIITCVSPMRGKIYLLNEVKIEDAYEHYNMSSQKAIFARDMFDVARTDSLFVNLLNAKRVSIGSVMEITYAWVLRKPCIIVMENDNIHHHAMIREAAPWIVTTVDEGIEIARKLLLV